MWRIGDLLERRGSGDEQEVKVKWDNYLGEPEWILLANNPELKKYLLRNKTNP